MASKGLHIPIFTDEHCVGCAYYNLLTSGDQRYCSYIFVEDKKRPYHKSGFPKGEGFDSGLDWAFREDIDKLPTVDAEPVKHGLWVKLGKHDWACSVCRRVVPYSYTGHKYCPNCGAKMDGDGNG